MAKGKIDLNEITIGVRFPGTLGEAVKIRLDASSGRLQVALIHHMLRT